MFTDLSWSHILLVLVVALVVVGPKDLPNLMRTMGQWAGKARAMADQFRKSFDEMARQSELDELRKEIDELRTMRPLAEPSAMTEALEPPVEHDGDASRPRSEAAPTRRATARPPSRARPIRSRPPAIPMSRPRHEQSPTREAEIDATQGAAARTSDRAAQAADLFAARVRASASSSASLSPSRSTGS